MLKLSSSGIKKGMSILLAAFFIVSLTAVAASAYNGGYGDWGGYGIDYDGYGYGWGDYLWCIGLSLGHSYPYSGWGYY